MFYLLIVIRHCLCDLPTILDDVYKNRNLHTYQPHFVRRHSTHTIEKISDWRKLFQVTSPDPVLIFFETFCALPDIETLRDLRQKVTIFGPIYQWHHLNFGTFSELELVSLSHTFEAHLSQKLSQCDKTRTDLQSLLDSPAVFEWYAQQQMSIYHSKLRPYAIGFGYNNLRAKDDFNQHIPQYKQLMLESLERNRGRPRYNLLIAAFNKHTELYRGSLINDPRALAIEAIRGNVTLGVDKAHVFRNDEEWLDALATTKFIASPQGWGPDCHRHYEAIAMGCVPVIIEEYTVSQLLENMPVLILHSWSELTYGGAAFLEREYQKILRNSYRYNLDKLFEDYWLKRLLNDV